MKPKVLHGRNEHGFVIGSQQAEQFQRMLNARGRAADDSSDAEKAASLREKLLRRLETPAWWYERKCPDDMPTRNRRSWARLQARAAASKLGVPVPEWVLRRVRKYYVPEAELVVGDLT
jgi:hypothetical protein